MPQTIYIMLGAIAGAIITAMVTLTRILISKEESISELRHEWLTYVRKELSSPPPHNRKGAGRKLSA